MKKIFFTGVTGFLGRFLAVEMLKKGWEIIFLIRPGKMSVDDRLTEALNFVESQAAQVYKNQWTVIAGDVTWNNFGIEDLHILSNVEEFWHVAGAVTFSEIERDITFKINLDGVKNLTKIAEKVNISRLHYFSTAYIREPGVSTMIEETKDSLFHEKGCNPYERSKNFAERHIHKWAKRHPDVNVCVYRPSIVVGNSKSGKMYGFTGYYRVMQTFHTFACAGKIAKEMSVPGRSDATVNLVTVDWVVDMVMKIQHIKDVAGIFHLTNEAPPNYEWLLESSLRALDISCSPVVAGQISANKEQMRIEKMFKRGLKDYIPYISEDVKFSTNHLKNILGEAYKEHPSFNDKLVKTLLDYAVRARFGN